MPNCRLYMKVDRSPPGDRLQKDHKPLITIITKHYSVGRNHLKDMRLGLIRSRLNTINSWGLIHASPKVTSCFIANTDDCKKTAPEFELLFILLIHKHIVVSQIVIRQQLKSILEKITTLKPKRDARTSESIEELWAAHTGGTGWHTGIPPHLCTSGSEMQNHQKQIWQVANCRRELSPSNRLAQSLLKLKQTVFFSVGVSKGPLAPHYFNWSASAVNSCHWQKWNLQTPFNSITGIVWTSPDRPEPPWAWNHVGRVHTAGSVGQLCLA